MAKRKEDTPPPGSPAWMATFSDLMNLLLCFFVMLFSMSTVSEEKWQEMVAAMNDSFSIFNAGSTAIGDGILISNGVSQLHELDQYINSMGRSEESDSDSENLEEEKNPGQNLEEMLAEQKLQENEIMAEIIEEAVQESNMEEQIEVNFTSQYVQLTMKGALLFDSGSADLKEDASKVLEKVGVILERYSNGTIEIEGHTDNIPINTSKFASNEELSSARALSVFYYLTENTVIDPTYLRHAGMGERVPIADNSTAEGRSKNRRVEIKIYNSF
uniref:OmpA/MotB family protein n=1 Tax=Acetatifactor sp. TaxID=1872090 RepID=UPI0040575C50